MIPIISISNNRKNFPFIIEEDSAKNALHKKLLGLISIVRKNKIRNS